MRGPFFWLLLVGYSLGACTPRACACARASRSPSATVVLGAAVDAYQDGVTAYLSSVCLIALAPILFGQVLRNRARLNGALHSARRTRRARARGGRRRRRARRAHPDRRRAARRRRARARAMIVQAGAARRMAERDPARAEATFAVVENTGREALTEMRRLLGVLRREDEELALAPQPSLAHVALADPARGRGRPARRAAGRRRARAAARRRRPHRLPARPGGAAARARGRRARRARACASATRPARCGSRSPTTAGPRTAACSACASASRSTAASSTPAGRRRRLARGGPAAGGGERVRLLRRIDPRAFDWALALRVRRLGARSAPRRRTPRRPGVADRARRRRRAPARPPSSAAAPARGAHALVGRRDRARRLADPAGGDRRPVLRALLFPYMVGANVAGARALIARRRSWPSRSPPSRCPARRLRDRATSSSRPSSAC